MHMKRVLFVCLGNICRSPAAEGVMRMLVAESELADQIHIDSAGTGAYHVGCPPDARMREHASRRGYKLESLARQFDAKKDFTEFDYILTMDKSNFRNIRALDKNDLFKSKVIPLVKFCTVHEVNEVPDPYYGGEDGFELVMDIVEDGCRGLLEHLRKEIKG